VRLSSVAVHTATTFVGYAVRLALQLIGTAILTRTLGPSDFGAFAAALAAASILGSLTEAGGFSLVIRDTARGIGPRQAIGNALLRVALLLPATLPALFLFKLLALPYVPWGLTLSLAISHLVFGRVLAIVQGMFVAKQQFWRNAVLETTAGALFLLLAAVLNLADGDVMMWGLLVIVQFALVSLLGFIWLVRQYGWPSTSLHVALADLREGLYFASSTVMQLASADFDKVLLARLSSLEATGVYSAAARIVQLAYLPLNAFLAAVNSRFFQAGAQGSEHAMRFALRILPYTAAYGLIASVALYAIAPLLPVIFGTGFSSSTTAIRWLALIPLLQGLYFPFADALAGSNSIRLRTSAQAGALAVGVILGFTLIPPLGWLGAAIAVLSGQFSLLVSLVVMAVGRRRGERDRSQRQGNG